MAEFLQTQFNEFHEKIKLNTVEDYKELREKRDMLIKELRDWCKINAKPNFTEFNQGSYDMRTGIVPLEGEDYDIDTGVEFHLSIDEYDDPTEVKDWVIKAFSSRPNRNVQPKTPCVRVQYEKAGDPKFHIDFAVYGRKDVENPKTDMYLAVGKPNAKDENKKWDSSEPFTLKNIIADKFSDIAERAQMRRCIRYLKRWKDYKFSDGRPTGISFTAMALNWFVPYVKDIFSRKDKISDLDALKNWVNKIKSNYYGLYVTLPVQPYNDLFTKIKANQLHLSNYQTRLSNLLIALQEASEEPDTHQAAKILEKQFGKDFPVPPKNSTARTTSGPAIAPSVGSA